LGLHAINKTIASGEHTASVHILLTRTDSTRRLQTQEPPMNISPSVVVNYEV